MTYDKQGDIMINTKQVILNLDGVLFDTQKLIVETWKTVCQSHGIAIDQRFFIRILDAGDEEKERLFYQFYQQRDLEDEVNQHVSALIAQANHDHRSLLQPGMEAFLAQCLSLGIRVSVISSQNRAYTEQLLANLATPYPFAEVVSADDVITAKPQPHLFQRIANLSKIPLSDSIAVENTRNGLLAAYLAHVKTYFIEDIFNKHDHEDLIKYSYSQIRSISEIQLAH